MTQPPIYKPQKLPEPAVIYKPIEDLFKPIVEEEKRLYQNTDYQIDNHCIGIKKYRPKIEFSFNVIYRFDNDKPYWQANICISGEIDILKVGSRMLDFEYYKFDTLEQITKFIHAIDIIKIANTYLSLNYHMDEQGCATVNPEELHIIPELQNEIQMHAGLAYL